MKNLNLEHNQYGNGQRLLLQEKVLSGGLKIPKAVEYDDIDNAMIEFFDAAIDLNDDNGQKVPIFKLLSNVLVNIPKCGNVLIKMVTHF